MRPSITTVLSARPWEPALTRLATATALARVVGRAWEPATVDATSPDVVVIGVETAWLSRALVQSWQRVGRAVVGVHGRGSPAERQALAGLGVDHAIGDGDVEALLLAACRVASTSEPAAPLVAVTGARGAPGRSTVAIAMAAGWDGATVVDDDPEPNLGPLLGLPPGPIQDDLVRSLRSTGTIPGIHTRAGIRVLAPFGPVPGEAIACLRSKGPVIVDTGPFPVAHRLSGTTHEVFVVDASAVGLVRAGAALRDWRGRPPVIVLNRAPDRPTDAIRACRVATGLEPTAVIARSDQPIEAARSALEGLAA